MFTKTTKTIITHFKNDSKVTHTKSPPKSPPKTAMSNQAKTSPSKKKAGPILTFGQAKKQKASESPIKSFACRDCGYIEKQKCQNCELGAGGKSKRCH